jgi:hypothetical protein
MMTHANRTPFRVVLGALAALALCILPAPVVHAEERMDRLLAPGTGGQGASAGALGTRDERVQAFRSRALTLKITVTTRFSRYGNSTYREVDLRDGKKRGYSEDELAELTADPRLSNEASKASLGDKLGTAACLGQFLVLPVTAVAGAAAGFLVGCAAGGVLGAGAAITADVVGALALFFLAPVAGLVIGAVVGAVVGFPSSIVAGALSNLVVQPTLTLLFPPVPNEHYALMVHQYNSNLAKELGLEEKDLDPAYFPLSARGSL